MDERVSISKEELDKVKNKLKKDKGLTINDVSERINSDFGNYVYKGFNLDVETFEKLRSLFSEEIEHELVEFRNGVSYEKSIGELEKNVELAEFIGVVLGDGNIREFSDIEEGKHITVYKTRVTLHQDEEKIINRVKELFSKISGRDPKTYSSKNSKAFNIYVYSKELVERLKHVGLTSGDKKENQVSVPKWVKEDKKFEKACLKGLIDTDGTIYVRKHDSYEVIQFKNASDPLLKDFKQMCEDFDISVSKGGYRTVQIASQAEVDKFIDLIQPIKAESLSS